jgi:hypothetical protein
MVNSDQYICLTRTRDVRFGDFAVLKDLLNARGFDVCELDRKGIEGEFGHGGIEFPTKPTKGPKYQYRDVRFGGKNLPATFDPEDDRIWGAFEAPVWNASNQFRVWIRGRSIKFGPQAAALQADICSALGVFGKREVKAAKRANRAAKVVQAAAARAAAAPRIAAKKAAAAKRDADERAFRFNMAQNALLFEEHGPVNWE